MRGDWHNKIFSLTDGGFDKQALEIFQLQYLESPVYNAYVNALGIRPASVDKIEKIPFLPINFFKTDEIKTGRFNPEVVFRSSGTTQTVNSYHYVKETSIYIESFTKGFERMYDQISDWCIVGLLPSYLERGNSSLVYMVEELIKQSGHPLSGFYLNDLEKLNSTLTALEGANQKTLLIGVTYALLDFAEKFPRQLQHTVLMETGGMKGRRKELTRMEIHDQLKKAFGKEEVHSEYGMTELLSQAYAKKLGKFECPPWMKVLIRDEEDPLAVSSTVFQSMTSVNGAINIIDLANVYSCSFIATDDAGRLYSDGSFEVLGRMDGSDLRGCSLLTI